MELKIKLLPGFSRHPLDRCTIRSLMKIRWDVRGDFFVFMKTKPHLHHGKQFFGSKKLSNCAFAPCMWIYIYIYMYIYIYIYIHTHMHVYIRTIYDINTRIHLYTRTYIHTHMHAFQMRVRPLMKLLRWCSPPALLPCKIYVYICTYVCMICSEPLNPPSW
jgi:hypothetical protein